MKFESKFGLGEIVVSKHRRRDGKLCGDHLGEVIAITFERNQVCYHVRLAGDAHVIGFAEHELIGDDLYDQETGSYPPEAAEEGETHTYPCARCETPIPFNEFDCPQCGEHNIPF